MDVKVQFWEGVMVGGHKWGRLKGVMMQRYKFGRE